MKAHNSSTKLNTITAPSYIEFDFTFEQTDKFAKSILFELDKLKQEKGQSYITIYDKVLNETNLWNTLKSVAKFSKEEEWVEEGFLTYHLFEYHGMDILKSRKEDNMIERRINLDANKAPQLSDSFYVLKKADLFLLNNGSFGKISDDILRGDTLKNLFDKIRELENDTMSAFSWESSCKAMKVTANYNLQEVEK